MWTGTHPPHRPSACQTSLQATVASTSARTSAQYLADADRWPALQLSSTRPALTRDTRNAAAARSPPAGRCYLHACALRIGGGGGRGLPPVQIVLRPAEGALFASGGFAAAWDAFVLPAMGLSPGPSAAAAGGPGGADGRAGGGAIGMLACLSESDPLVMA